MGGGGVGYSIIGILTDGGIRSGIGLRSGDDVKMHLTLYSMKTGGRACSGNGQRNMSGCNIGTTWIVNGVYGRSA